MPSRKKVLKQCRQRAIDLGLIANFEIILARPEYLPISYKMIA